MDLPEDDTSRLLLLREGLTVEGIYIYSKHSYLLLNKIIFLIFLFTEGLFHFMRPNFLTPFSLLFFFFTPLNFS